jgi:hypothetical protein
VASRALGKHIKNGMNDTQEITFFLILNGILINYENETAY